MRVVGVTGRMGTGKSTVARWLEAYGAVLIDSDALVAELYASDRELHTALQARFGSEVISGGRVNKEVLIAALTEPGALGDLERIVHPAVSRLRDVRLKELRRRGATACVVEAIKLVESGGSQICDELWIVVAAERVQLERLARRGVDEAEARRRMAWQGTPATWTERFLDESVRIGRARPVIVFDNGGSEEEGRAEAARLWMGVSAERRGAP